jgi:hypothetical protein
LVGIDRFGNKYFENMEEELPRMLRIPYQLELRS